MSGQCRYLYPGPAYVQYACVLPIGHDGEHQAHPALRTSDSQRWHEEPAPVPKNFGCSCAGVGQCSWCELVRVREERDQARADFANCADVGRRLEERLAAAERERDRAHAERAALRSALVPFAHARSIIERDHPGLREDVIAPGYLALSHFRRADEAVGAADRVASPAGEAILDAVAERDELRTALAAANDMIQKAYAQLGSNDTTLAAAVQRLMAERERWRVKAVGNDALRDEVKVFAKIMERVLSNNDYKGGWGHCTPLWLLRRLQKEARELERAIRRYKRVGRADAAVEKDAAIKVALEAVDVANFALMIADVVGELEEP